jgi:hypothetical protein
MTTKLRARLAAVAIAAVLAVFGLAATAMFGLAAAATATPTASGAFTLTVTTTGTGSGSVGVDSSPCATFPCVTEEPFGTVVGLTVAPTGNSVFTGWTGACAGQGTQCTLTMTADQTTSAVFDLPAATAPATTAGPTAPPSADPSAPSGTPPAGGSPTASVQGATAEPTTATPPPGGPATPSAAPSADPSAPAPGGSGGPPWLPIGAGALLVVAVVGAYRFGVGRPKP